MATYVVHNADEFTAAFLKVKGGDCIWVVIPPDPKTFGFKFIPDPAAPPEEENPWSGCCC